MRPVVRADLAAVDDAKQRRADGLRAGAYWHRRNPSGKAGANRGRWVDAAFGRSGLPMGRKPAASRNEPCPCGSGKKFKRCCISAPGGDK